MQSLYSCPGNFCFRWTRFGGPDEVMMNLAKTTHQGAVANLWAIWSAHELTKKERSRRVMTWWWLAAPVVCWDSSLSHVQSGTRFKATLILPKASLKMKRSVVQWGNFLNKKTDRKCLKRNKLCWWKFGHDFPLQVLWGHLEDVLFAEERYAKTHAAPWRGSSYGSRWNTAMLHEIPAMSTFVLGSHQGQNCNTLRKACESQEEHDACAVFPCPLPGKSWKCVCVSCYVCFL